MKQHETRIDYKGFRIIYNHKKSFASVWEGRHESCFMAVYADQAKATQRAKQYIDQL